MPKAPNPYWAAHTIILAGTSSAGSGTRKWKCRYCDVQQSSSITRVIRHISKLGGKGIEGCKGIPQELADAIIRENPKEFPDGTGTRSTIFNDDVLLDPLPQSDAGGSRKRPRVAEEGDGEDSVSHATAASHSSQPKINSSMHSLSWVKERQRRAEIEIERTLIECNISFNVLRTDQWKRMIAAVAAVGNVDGWTGLEYNRMRTTMLSEEKERIEASLVPIKEGWKKFGCTIISDGWSDTRRRHIINILVSSCLGTYFLRAVDAGKAGEHITAEFIYHHIEKAILDVGVENVVQVVTDNASNCKRMGEMVEREFPSIVWTPCAAHSLDLLIEDIGSLGWVKPVLDDATRIASFFRKKHQALAIFRSHSPKDIVHPSKTRFAYMYVVLDRLYEVRDALRRSVVDAPWRLMHNANHETTRSIQRKVLDEDFWSDVHGITLVLKPIFLHLRITDMEGSTMGLFYHLFKKMRREIDASTAVTRAR